MWRASHRNGTVSDTVPLRCPMSRMGLGRRLSERYRGKLFRGTRVCGRWSRSTSFSPREGHVPWPQEERRHAPAPLEYRGSQGYNGTTDGDTRRGAERRLWGESSPVVARLLRRDNLQPSAISVTPTEEIPQTWPTEGDLAEEIVAPSPSWPTHLARPEVGQRRPPVQTLDAPPS